MARLKLWKSLANYSISNCVIVTLLIIFVVKPGGTIRNNVSNFTLKKVKTKNSTH